MQSGLVEFGDAGAGQVQLTGLDGQQQRQVGQQGVVDPFLAGTRWTHDDIRTLSSLATLVVALLALGGVLLN